MTARRTALALCAALVQGCTAPWWLHLPPRLAACPGPIPPTETLPAGDFVWQDRARYRGGEVDVGFALVAEKRGARLVLVGLNPFGARVFSLVQEGAQVESEARIGRALQVPPETVLRDWHAARAAAAPSLEVARPECGYTATFAAESRRAL